MSLALAGSLLSFGHGCTYKVRDIASKHSVEDCTVVKSEHRDAVYKTKLDICSERDCDEDGENCETSHYPCTKRVLVSPEYNHVELICSVKSFVIDDNRSLYNVAVGKKSVSCEYAQEFESTKKGIPFWGKLIDIKQIGYKLLHCGGAKLSISFSTDVLGKAN